jgi:hypothetical protein
MLLSGHASYQNYTDYFKCIAAKGEDFAPCKQFKRAYNSLCPSKSSPWSFSWFIVSTCKLLDEWVCHKSVVHLF